MRGHAEGAIILGLGRRGVEKGPAGGGGEDSDFSSKRGEGYCKIAKRAPKQALFEGV